MLLRIGPRLKPISSYRRVRWRMGAPVYWGIADQGGSLIDATDGRVISTINGTVTNSANNRGPALKCDGSSGFIGNIPGSLITAAGTLTLRITPNGWSSGGGTDQGICGSANDSTHFFRIQRYLDNNWYCGWDNGTDNRVTVADSVFTVTAGVEFTLTLTWGTAGSFLYKNGVQVATNGTAPSTTALTNYLTVGRYSQGGSGNGGTSPTYTASTFDECRIYNYQQTGSQVLADVTDPWWRLRPKRPRWMGKVSGAAFVPPWWEYDRPMMGALGNAS